MALFKHPTRLDGQSTTSHVESPVHPIKSGEEVLIQIVDKMERTQQVSIMGEIYQQATQLTIWLGEEDEKTGMGMTLIVKFSSMRNHIEDHQSLKNLTEDRAKELGIPTFGERCEVSEKWQSFFSILVRPWFRRVWVRGFCLLFRCSCDSFRESSPQRGFLEPNLTHN